MPVLLGCHDDKTPFQLWQEKLGLRSSEISTYARGKGGETEARIRAKYSLETGLNFGPVLAAHDEYPWLLASLDGYFYADGQHHIIEIKFVGQKVFDAGLVPRKHAIQCQQQMLVIGASELVYLMSADGDSYKKIVIKADEKMQKEIVHAGTLFYSYMTLKNPPPLVENDWWPGDAELEKAVENWSLNIGSDSINREKIRALMKNKRMEVPGYRLTVDVRGVLRVTKKS